jgi:hypothetical protein
LLEAIQDATRNGRDAFSPEHVMNQVAKSVSEMPDDGLKRAILLHFNDLLRTGVVGLGDPKSIAPRGHSVGATSSWPHGAANVTPTGQDALNQANRDPLNRQGYLAHVEAEIRLDTTTIEYVEEALSTYRACCYKAAAVLIGAAVENLVLDVRDELVDRMKRRGEKPRKQLTSDRVKEVTDAIFDHVMPDLISECKRSPNLRRLKEETESRLKPCAADFRRLRNDAGHPASLGTVRATDVHANLLLFPSTARMLLELKTWITSHYV